MIAHRFLPLAREELNEAASFYEERVPGLGAMFLDDVERAIEAVRVPYSIVYALRDEGLVVVAIAHQRKRPGYWRRRQ